MENIKQLFEEERAYLMKNEQEVHDSIMKTTAAIRKYYEKYQNFDVVEEYINVHGGTKGLCEYLNLLTEE